MYCAGFIQGPCPPGWQGFNGGKCFKYYSIKKTWTEALRNCQQCSSNPTSTLASIPDSATNDFLLSSVAPLNSPGLWVGGHQNSAGTWGWSDGTRWSYQKWYPGEPNNSGGIEDHIELMTVNNKWGYFRGKWNDHRNSFKAPYICQLCRFLFCF